MISFVLSGVRCFGSFLFFHFEFVLDLVHGCCGSLSLFIKPVDTQLLKLNVNLADIFISRKVDRVISNIKTKIGTDLLMTLS